MALCPLSIALEQKRGKEGRNESRKEREEGKGGRKGDGEIKKVEGEGGREGGTLLHY